MKRMLSIVMALVLVLSLGTVAFADTVSYTATAKTTFEEVVKTYTSENDVVVNETLSFASTASTSNPDGGAANLTVADLTVSSLNPGTLTVTIPSLSVAGTYEWTIKEKVGSTAGVTYSTDEVHVIVLVEYDNNTHALKIANTTSYIKGVKAEDSDEVVKKKDFTNTFASGSFTVEKAVTGNMANENDKFDITVTLTSSNPIGTKISVLGTDVETTEWTKSSGTWTYTKELNISKADGKQTFSNIPVGVVVTVSEKKDSDRNDGYTYVSTKIGEDDFTELTVADDTNAAIVVTNQKTSEITTGISMDTLPYVLLLAVACMGIIAVVSKKRLARER